MNHRQCLWLTPLSCNAFTAATVTLNNTMVFLFLSSPRSLSSSIHPSLPPFIHPSIPSSSTHLSIPSSIQSSIPPVSLHPFLYQPISPSLPLSGVMNIVYQQSYLSICLGVWMESCCFLKSEFIFLFLTPFLSASDRFTFPQ